MKKPLPTGVLVAVVVVLVVLIGFAFVRFTSPSTGVWTDEQRDISQALDKVGNDPSKLDPEMRKRLDEELAKHPMSSGRSGGSSGSMPPGGVPGSGAPGGSPMPEGYPTGSGQ